MEPERAQALVAHLVDADEFVCGDCGRQVDVSHCSSELDVVALLSTHKSQHHGGDS